MKTKNDKGYCAIGVYRGKTTHNLGTLWRSAYILGAAYILWLYKRVIFGKITNQEVKKMLDLSKSEMFILWSLAIPILFFGFYPEPLINTMEVSISNLIETYNINIQNYVVIKNEY